MRSWWPGRLGRRRGRSAPGQAGPIILTGGVPPDEVPEPQPEPDRRTVVQVEADAAAFAAILALADDVAAHRPEALVELAALLGRRIQAGYLTAVLARPDDTPGLVEAEPSTRWFDTRLPLTPDGRRLDELLVPVAGAHLVDLATDLVLPWPWDRGRLAGALSTIGEGRPWGPWRADPANHLLLLWLPLGIAWVAGGNHSLAAGIALGEGRVRAEETRDMRAVYEHVTCDGRQFARRHDGASLGPIRDPSRRRSSRSGGAWSPVG